MVVAHFRELYRYRVLIQALVWREAMARYRGSFFGFFWTLLNPLFLLIVYRLVFTKMTHAVDLQNYAVFFFVGILPWLWIAGSVNQGTTSFTTGGALVTRICIPPQILPAMFVLSNLVNFLLALPVALIAAAIYGIYPGSAILLLPVAILFELLFVYGLALALATLNVRFRDIQFLVLNLVTVWFLITPIAYPLEQALAQLPPRWRPLAIVNPATSLVLPFQDILYARHVPTPVFFASGAAWACVMCAIGIAIFESRRDTLAEEI